MVLDKHILKELVDGCRILADHGQGDLIWGHVSLRHPERPDEVLIKPAGLGLEEITEDHIIVSDMGGNRILGDYPMHVEVFIHTEILRARPEIGAVVHTHPPHAVAFSSLDMPLEPVGHEGSLFRAGLPVYDRTSDLIVTQELGASLAQTLGGHSAALMQNHGIVTAGRNVKGAVMTALLLEKACMLQMLAMASGKLRKVSSDEDATAKCQRLYTQKTFDTAFDYCARRASARPCGCSQTNR